MASRQLNEYILLCKSSGHFVLSDKMALLEDFDSVLLPRSDMRC